MSLKVLSIGTEKKIINGNPVVNRNFNIDIDSQRNKNKQVNALIQDENIQYQMQDSLGNFLSRLNNNNNSLFTLLKKDERIVKKPDFISNLKRKMRKRLKKTQKQSKQSKILSEAETKQIKQTKKKKKKKETRSSKK